MTHLEVTLTARAHQMGRALRTASFRHRRLVRKPLALVLWQLGAEPFSAAAIGFGTGVEDLHFAVAGEPRNRDLSFEVLLHLARWFNPRFEAYASNRETLPDSRQTSRAVDAPQIIVANEATVEMIHRLGRRLAYLQPHGDRSVPPELIKLGRHFQFLARHFAMPGQQLVVPMTDLLNRHWTTSLSPLERMSLAALDAYIAPPAGMHGFHAAVAAEKRSMGPVPAGEDDQELEPLVEAFNQQRNGRTAWSVVAPLLGPIENHYRPMVERTWQVLWRCRDREVAWPEAASVARRWDEDRQAYTDHIDWCTVNGLRRTRETSRQAAMLMRRWEEAQQRAEAEEACDDPLRMIPYILDNKAVQGEVVMVDREYRERPKKRFVRRPLVVLETEVPCLMPVGKELWWAADAAASSGWVIHEVQTTQRGGSHVTLKLETGSSAARLPEVGMHACFSIHTTTSHWHIQLPIQPPWSHQAPEPLPAPQPIEQ